MKKTLCYLLIAGILFGSNTDIFSQSKEYRSKYDPVRIQRLADVQQGMIDYWFMGSSHVVIYKDGEIIYDGIVNSGREGDKDITEKTIFPIWSMSKPITTVAVMILFEEGKFKLDDPVWWYIPELKTLQCLDEDRNPYPCKNQITIRNLLAHESGFRYYSEEHDGKSYLIYDKNYKNLEDLVKLLANRPLSFEPGTKYGYGLSTTILGRFVEVISQQEFYVFLKERIFDPLDMHDTDFDITDDERKRFQPLFVREKPTGYYTTEYGGLGFLPGTKVQLGGEGLVSTTEDYSHFCEMLLNDGIYNGKRILSPASISLMHQPMTGSLFRACRSGFTFYHLTDPILDGALSPEGIFGWGGAEGTFFWIDQKNNLYGLLMTRRNGTSSFPLWPKFRLATYQAIY